MYQWAKKVVQWRCGKTLYLSVPFTWMLGEAEAIAKAHKGKVVAGGPAVKLAGAPWADETPDECQFDVLSMHNPCATFTTRGCPNRCGFCAVPKLEGEFRELETWKPSPLICDNNLLTASNAHFGRVIDSVKRFPLVDFNQGLDARQFTSFHACQITRLKSAKVRFAFDHVNVEQDVANAIMCCREHGLGNFGVYVLFGYKDTMEDALYRLEWCREWGIMPNAMRYQPLDAVERNAYVAPQWDEHDLKRVHRYYSRLIHLGHIPFDEYDLDNEPLFAAARKE